MSWQKHSATHYTLGPASLVKVGSIWVLTSGGVTRTLRRGASFDHAEAIISEQS